MRYENFAPDEHYHVFGRGINQEKIFIDNQDKARFTFLITHFQSPARIYNISWYTDAFIKKGSFNLKEDRVKEILKKRSIELISFVLMSNHFHILVQNLQDKILSVYMHRILTAYSKYFNAKYNKKGHVFEGPFKAVHIKNNNQLLHLSAYIHKNPKEIKEWENTYDQYPYSSYQDYLGSNRWGKFLSTDIILKQFKDQSKYKEFVTFSTAKEFF
ncbi:MAG: transposase [Candidatus Zambryskibacteria bacterium]|nr:transposase [Candidatus Zambryskibacteria bacterium]